MFVSSTRRLVRPAHCAAAGGLGSGASGVGEKPSPQSAHQNAHLVTRARSAMKRPSAATLLRRQTVVAALLAGSSVGEAAALAGVRRETASRYLSEPAVVALLTSERDALASQTRNAVHALHREAVFVALRDLRTSQSPDRALAILRLTLRAGFVEDAPRREAAELAQELEAGSHDRVLETLINQLMEGIAER